MLHDLSNNILFDLSNIYIYISNNKRN